MDLNKPVNLNFKFDLKTFKGSEVGIGVSIIAIIIAIYCLFKLIDVTSIQSLINDESARYETLQLDVDQLKKDFTSLEKDNKDIIYDLDTAPKNETELTSDITELVGLNKLKIEDLIVLNDRAQNPLGPSVTIAVSGSYAGIKKFLSNLSRLLVFSEINEVEIKKEQSKLIAKINFTFKPKEDLFKTSLFDHNGDLIFDDGFSFAYKKNPLLRNVGFVPLESENDDPFAELESEKKSTQVQSDNENTNPENAPAPKVYFLTGTIDSEKNSFCTIQLPSGETKVFRDYEEIFDEIKVLKIHNGFIHICKACKGNFKKISVGEEIKL